MPETKPKCDYRIAKLFEDDQVVDVMGLSPDQAFRLSGLDLKPTLHADRSFCKFLKYYPHKTHGPIGDRIIRNDLRRFKRLRSEIVDRYSDFEAKLESAGLTKNQWRALFHFSLGFGMRSFPNCRHTTWESVRWHLRSAIRQFHQYHERLGPFANLNLAELNRVKFQAKYNRSEHAKLGDPLSVLTSQDIRSARLAKGWTQQKLAIELGVSKMSISMWETGKRNVSYNRRRDLWEILGTHIESLK